MRRIGWLFALAAFAVLPGRALAIPELQLYVQGGTYNSTTETWELSTTGDTVTVWVIGNTSANNSTPGAGDIFDVKLAVAYATTSGPITLQVQGTTTGGIGGFTDPSTPSDPSTTSNVGVAVTSNSGPFPQVTQGSGTQDLPSHGIYQPGVSWTEYALGNFTLTDSPIGDFITSFPTPSGTNEAQINAYTIKLLSASASPVSLHFDAYNSAQAGNSGKWDGVFAPFSHDAETTSNSNPVPEPSTIAMLLSGLVPLGLVGLSRLRRRRNTNAG